MAKQITLTHEGKTYVLEYTRKSIEQMERNGFRIEDITEKPITALPTLFAGAFLANERWTKRLVIDDIFDNIVNKTELIGKLAELYNEPLASMLEEPEEDEKNVEWEATF